MKALPKFKRVAVAACAVAAGLFAQSAKAEMTSYWAWDATKGIVCAQQYKSAMVLGTDKTLTKVGDNTLSTGWYVVKGKMVLRAEDYGDLAVEKNATVNLILADGASLEMYECSLIVPYGATLNIYGQKLNTGKLTVDLYRDDKLTYDESLNAAIGGRGYQSNGTINIHGGVITAKGYWGAGIGAGGAADDEDLLIDQMDPITVYGGVVKAFSRKGAGIGGGSDTAHALWEDPGHGNGGLLKAVGGIVAGYTSGHAPGIGGGATGYGGELHADGACIVGDSKGPWEALNPAHGIGSGYWAVYNGTIAVDKSVNYTIKYGDYEDADWSGTLTEDQIALLAENDELKYNVYYFGWKHAITLNPAVSGQHLDVKWALVNPDGSVGRESDLTKTETVYAETVYPKTDGRQLGFPEGVTISHGVQVTYSCQNGYKFPDGSSVKIVYIHPTRVRGDIALLIGGSGVYDVPAPVPVCTLVVPAVEHAHAQVWADGTEVDDLSKIPLGAEVTVVWTAAPGYVIADGEFETFVMDGDRTAKTPTVLQPIPEKETPCILFPNGDGGKFVPAAKGKVVYAGAVIGAAGVEGTIELKMTKPNKNTGLFNVSATVKTVDNQKFSFKANKVSAPTGAPFTVEVPASNKKSMTHKLTVTLEGNSMTGTFDGAKIDGASNAFKDKRSARAMAIKSFVGTWTGSFFVEANAPEMFYSATVSKSGKTKVKVVLPDGKTVGCTATAEVGDGIIAVPVMVRKSASGAVQTFGFRLAFGAGEDVALVCRPVNVSPLKVTGRKTGGAIRAVVLKYFSAGRPAVTTKEFKSFVMRAPELEKKLGRPTKDSLKMAKTGIISGSIKWGKVSGKASGVVIGSRGVGLLAVKIDGAEVTYGFTAESMK